MTRTEVDVDPPTVVVPAVAARTHTAVLWVVFLLLWAVVEALAIGGRMRSRVPLAAATTTTLNLALALPSVAYLVHVARNARRLADGREPFVAARVGPTIVFGVQATASLVLALHSALVYLARRGHAVTASPATDAVTEGEVMGALVWHAATAVPVLDLPRSLGWEHPVPDPAWPLGVAQVVVRFVFAGVLVSIVTLLWRAWRRSARGRLGVGPEVR